MKEKIVRERAREARRANGASVSTPKSEHLKALRAEGESTEEEDIIG